MNNTNEEKQIKTFNYNANNIDYDMILDLNEISTYHTHTQGSLYYEKRSESSHQAMRKCTGCSFTWAGATSSHVKTSSATCTGRAYCGDCKSNYGSYAPHSGGTATCNSLARCSSCGTSYGSYGSHSAGDTVYYAYSSSSYHYKWRLCKTCGTEMYKSTESHTQTSSATCTKKAYCGKCDSNYGSYGSHNLTSKYINITATQHTWVQYCSICDTETSRNTASHSGGNATCSTTGKCTNCGRSYYNSSVHSGTTRSGYLYLNSTEHVWQKYCNSCNNLMESIKGTHSGGTATCVERKLCSSCKENYGTVDNKNHKLTPTKTVLKFDDVQHVTMEKCSASNSLYTCQGSAEKRNHVATSKATCTQKAYCEPCGTYFGSMIPHDITTVGYEAVHGTSGHAYYGNCSTCSTMNGSHTGKYNTSWSLKSGIQSTHTPNGHSYLDTCTVQVKGSNCGTLRKNSEYATNWYQGSDVYNSTHSSGKGHQHQKVCRLNINGKVCGQYDFLSTYKTNWTQTKYVPFANTNQKYNTHCKEIKYCGICNFWDEAEFSSKLHNKVNNVCTTCGWSIKPQKWNWTANELDIFNGNQPMVNFSASRWNAFVDRVQDVLNFKFGSSAQNITSGKLVSSKTLTATKFNIVKNAIGGIYSTGIEDAVSKETKVRGSYFTTLSTNLNYIIDNLL